MNYSINITQDYIDNSNTKWIKNEKTLNNFVDGCPLENAFNGSLPNFFSVTIHCYLNKSAEIELWDNRSPIWGRRIQINFARAIDFIKRPNWQNFKTIYI